MASLPKAVDLLVAWESEGIGDEILKINVLQAWNGWREAARGVPSAAASREQLLWTVSVFCDAIGRCSDAVLGSECHKWSSALVQLLQEAEDAAVLQKVCHAVSNLLDRVHCCLDVRDFRTQQLPVLLSGLLRFASAQQLMQCLVLPVLAQCLVQFPATTLQSKIVMKSWVVKGMFAKNMELSQECSRLLVLLYQVPEQWSQLLSEVTAALHHLLQQTYSPVVESPQPPSAAPQPPSGAPQCPLLLPEVPIAEPQRSSTLLWQVVAVSRLLCYVLYFTPKEAVIVPVEDLLSAIFHGLSVQEVKGHSPEAVLLVGVLPVIHIAMWNLMAVVIHSCHWHLLPFSAGIELCFLREVSRLLSAWVSCQGLWLALGRVLQAWVALRRDGDPPFLAAALRWLIIGTRKERNIAMLPVRTVVGPPLPKKMRQAANPGKGSEELYLASVNCLSSIVQAVAFSLPLKQVKILAGLPRELLAEVPSPSLTEALLHLLQCYLVSGCPALMPSPSAAIQVFSQYKTHPNHKVHNECVASLAICSLQQYPTVPCLAQPVTPEHPPVSGAQELYFQWTGNQVQSPENLEWPLVKPTMELSPVVVEDNRTRSQEQCESLAEPHAQISEQDCQEAEPDPQEGTAEGPSSKDIDSDSSSDYELLRQFRDSSPDTWPEEESV